MSGYHTNLLKVLAEDSSVLSRNIKQDIRWALSMLNVLGGKIASETGLPISVVLKKASDIVIASEEFNWGCQECAGRGAGYCPTCKKSRHGTCGDCGKDLSDEERGQFRCELCSQYPSPESTVRSA